MVLSDHSVPCESVQRRRLGKPLRVTRPTTVTIEQSICFLESIFGTFGPDAGVPAEAVEAAQARLGLTLPRALVSLYRRTGSVTALHASHNLLVPLNRIAFGGDHLIFYEENQAVVVWAI